MRGKYSDDSALAKLNEALEDWRVLLTAGTILVMIAVAMQFKDIQEAFIHMPWWMYLAIGISSIGAGVWQFKKQL